MSATTDCVLEKNMPTSAFTWPIDMKSILVKNKKNLCFYSLTHKLKCVQLVLLGGITV